MARRWLQPALFDGDWQQTTDFKGETHHATADPALRQLYGCDGGTKHWRIARLGADHRAVHPRWLDSKRNICEARRADDHLPDSDPDWLHRWQAGLRHARRRSG